MSGNAPSQGSSGGWNRGVKSQIRTGLGRPRLRQTTLSTAAGTLGLSPDQISSSGARSTNAESASNNGRSNVRPSDENPAAATGVPGAYIATSDEDGDWHSAFSGDDEAVVINLEEEEDDEDSAAFPGHASKGAEQSELESGELSDHSPPGNTAHAAPSAGDGRQSESEEDGQINETDDDQGDEGEVEGEDMSMSDAYSPPPPGDPAPGRTQSFSRPAPGRTPNAPIHIPDDDDDEGNSENATMVYVISHSSASATPTDHSRDGPPAAGEAAAYTAAQTSSHVPDESGDLTLADISVTELQHQLRYYHIGRAPSSIPLTTLVRCPTCAGEGHLDASCPAAGTCTRCGTREAHLPSCCPQTPVAFNACSVCRTRGHNASQCERRWRTSAWPPATQLAILDERWHCYECGSRGHLGNQCPFRRPGKPMGTSSWSSLTFANGGFVPMCPDAGVADHLVPDAPGSLMAKRKRRDLRRQEAAVAAEDGGGGDLAAAAAANRQQQQQQRQQQLPQPMRSGAIKMGRGLGSGRDDLKVTFPQGEGNLLPSQPLHNASRTGKRGGKFSNKRNMKRDGAGESYRPMPSAAKKAFIQGKR